MTAYQPKNIELAKLLPVIGELAARCGSLEKAAEYSGLSTTTMYRMVRREHRTVIARTARILILALYQRRKEDRTNGHHKAFKKARMAQARIENDLERLAGY